MLPKKIYLAGGCFWGIQGYFKQVSGVINTKVGYANGYSDQTNYLVVHATNHAEAIEIEYDQHTIHLAEILDRFYKIIDPISVNRQSDDIGTQYRSGIYYIDEKSKQIAEKSIEILQKAYEARIAIQLQPLKNFVIAEEYHQDYLDKNPEGYCHIDLDSVSDVLYPAKYTLTDEGVLKKYGTHTKAIIRDKATEHPFSSDYDKNFSDGIYVDIVTGQPLFSSADKYDALCGWPSFTKAITTDVIKYDQDNSANMERTEVSSSLSHAHLGHVFDDGPKDMGGFRYCINGRSLEFIPVDEMVSKGYEKLLPYLI